MILDDVGNLESYRNLVPALGNIVPFLKSVVKLPPGRFELEGGVFALVQEYQTDKPEALREWEAHRRYIDVQCVISGREAMGWTTLGTLVSPKVYDETRDIVLSAEATASQELVVDAGQFALFFPHDAHRPCRSVEQPEPVRKIVVKIPV